MLMQSHGLASTLIRYCSAFLWYTIFVFCSDLWLCFSQIFNNNVSLACSCRLCCTRDFLVTRLKYISVLLSVFSCEKDINTHIRSNSGHELKFVFEDFQYTSSIDGLYLFCDALFCSTSDTSTRCQQRCETTKKRNIEEAEFRSLEVIRVMRRILPSH